MVVEVLWGRKKERRGKRKKKKEEERREEREGRPLYILAALGSSYEQLRTRVKQQQRFAAPAV